jgi:hypothetical protein
MSYPGKGLESCHSCPGSALLDAPFDLCVPVVCTVTDGSIAPAKILDDDQHFSAMGGGMQAFSEASCMQGAPSVLVGSSSALPWLSLAKQGLRGLGRLALHSPWIRPRRPMQVRERPAFDFLMAAPRVLKSANKTNGPGSVRPVPCCPSINQPSPLAFPGELVHLPRMVNGCQITNGQTTCRST